MTTKAYEFSFATIAGLTLIGREEGRPQWLGTKEQFDRWHRLCTSFENK